jgi:hypothetical protein
MISYWCKFFDAGGRVFGAETLAAEDDATVIAKAHVVFASGMGSGYEIWDGTRLVRRVTRPLSA